MLGFGLQFIVICIARVHSGVAAPHHPEASVRMDAEPSPDCCSLLLYVVGAIPSKAQAIPALTNRRRRRARPRGTGRLSDHSGRVRGARTG